MNNPTTPNSGGDGTPVPPRKGRKGSRPAPPPPSQGKAAESNKAGGGAKATTGNKGGGPQRASAARQARRRRNRFASVAVTGVVAVVAVVVIVGLSSSNSGKPTPRTPVPADIAAHLTSVPVNDLVAASAKSGSGLNAAVQLNDPGATGSKPGVLFIGAEFCPICATERWPMVVALSQFGTFGNLHQTRSAVRDGNIATLSFYGSTYTSRYLDFAPVETTTNVPKGSYYQLLQTPTTNQQTVWVDVLEKQLGASNVSFPFVYLNGKYVINTAQYSPSDLSGKNFTEIANDVGNNDTTIGGDIDAAAAALTKYLCVMTGDQPSNVCNAVANVTAPVSSAPSGSSTPAG